MRSDRPSPHPALLWLIGVVEAASFAALLEIVLATDNAGLRAGLGFFHGCVYLLSLAVAWWSVDDSRSQNLAVIPGIGALLMARRVSRHRPRR